MADGNASGERMENRPAKILEYLTLEDSRERISFFFEVLMVFVVYRQWQEFLLCSSTSDI